MWVLRKLIIKFSRDDDLDAGKQLTGRFEDPKRKLVTRGAGRRNQSSHEDLTQLAIYISLGAHITADSFASPISAVNDYHTGET